MADNYLEKQMEDYRAGRLNASRKIKPKLPMDGMRVFVTFGAEGAGRDIVEALRRRGCRVAFSDANRTRGTAVAQATGSQYHPIDITDENALTRSLSHIFTKWGNLDVIIYNTEDCKAENLQPLETMARLVAEHDATVAEPHELSILLVENQG